MRLLQSEISACVAFVKYCHLKQTNTVLPRILSMEAALEGARADSWACVAPRCIS